MGNEKKISSSYLDSIGSGFDAVGYDGPQLGKAETEEVSEKNWGADQRDAIGRAASISIKKRRIARKLRRIAAELEQMNAEMDKEYQDVVEDELQDEIDNLDEELQEEENLEVTAGKNHPIVKNNDTDPTANMSSETGDEWIDIGPGKFDDVRDVANRAS